EKAAAVPSGPADQFARQLYDRAAQAAASPAHQVNYRLSRARFAASRDDLPAVVRLYQEILLDPALRRITLSDARAGGATAAAVVAEREIAALIAQAGRAVYKPYDDAAAAAMAAAVDQGEP